jgi:hypothetical protein
MVRGNRKNIIVLEYSIPEEEHGKAVLDFTESGRML